MFTSSVVNLGGSSEVTGQLPCSEDRLTAPDSYIYFTTVDQSGDCAGSRLRSRSRTAGF